MEPLKIHIDKTDPMEGLMLHIEGKVFHVTKECNLASINESGEISPNINDELKTSFGSSKNSYFKNKGCVSVFDYRNIYDKEVQKHANKCRPTMPLSPESGIAIFILKTEIYSKLKAWEGWRNEDLSQMVVPHVEAGYLGPIPLSLVEKIIIVTITEDQSSLAVMLRKRLAR